MNPSQRAASEGDRRLDVLFGLAVLSGFAISLFYLPAAVALLLSTGLTDSSRKLARQGLRGKRWWLLANRFEAAGGEETVDVVPAAVGGLLAAVRAVEAWPDPGFLLDRRPALEADGLHVPRAAAPSPVT